MRIGNRVRTFGLGLVATGLIVSASCAEDSEDEPKTTPIVVGSGGGGSTATAGSLMLSIDTSCGGDPCIQSDVALKLEEGNGESFVQTIRGFYWLVTGFPDADSHAGFVPEGAHDLIPAAGLTGRIESVRAHVVETLIANTSGLTKCTDVPTSGSFEVADDGTYTLAEAKNSAPATYPKSGVYDKRIEYVGSEFDADFEWFCDYAGMMVKFEPKDSSGESLGFNFAFYYDREDQEDGHFEFFLNDKGLGALQSEPMSLALKVNVLSDSFRIWMTQSAKRGDNIGGYRAIGHTTIESQETSLWYQDLHNSDIAATAWDANEDVQATAVTTAVAPSAGESGSARQGCAENFSVQAHTISSSALCDGLTLEAPAAAAIDADGDWSMAWINASLADLIDAL